MKLNQNARELRQAGNLAEALLWLQLKKKQLGVGFDKQKVIGNYIVDFYSNEIKTVLEIDGSTHDYKIDYDKKRNEFLNDLGLTVIHLRDVDVKRNLEGVVLYIQNHVRECLKEGVMVPAKTLYPT